MAGETGRACASKNYTQNIYCPSVLLYCSQAKKPLKTPEDLAKHTLLHDASRRDWQAYTRQLGLNHINVQQGPIFSHSAMVLQAAIHGQGIALANNVMAQSEIEAGRLVCPFNDVLVSKNAFYLVCHDSQAELGKNSRLPSVDFGEGGDGARKIPFSLRTIINLGYDHDQSVLC